MMAFTPCQKRKIFSIVKFKVIKQQDKKDAQKEVGNTDLTCSQFWIF